MHDPWPIHLGGKNVILYSEITVTEKLYIYISVSEFLLLIKLSLPVCTE